MGVDRVGFALSSTGPAIGLFALDHGQAGGGNRAGQPNTVAAGALDGDGHPLPWRQVDYPSQQLGVAGAVIADLACRDRSAGRERDLHLVESRWVSTPTTASTSSANMGTGLVLPAGSGST